MVEIVGILVWRIGICVCIEVVSIGFGLIGMWEYIVECFYCGLIGLGLSKVFFNCFLFCYYWFLKYEYGFKCGDIF